MQEAGSRSSSAVDSFLPATTTPCHMTPSSSRYKAEQGYLHRLITLLLLKGYPAAAPPNHQIQLLFGHQLSYTSLTCLDDDVDHGLATTGLGS